MWTDQSKFACSGNDESNCEFYCHCIVIITSPSSCFQHSQESDVTVLSWCMCNACRRPLHVRFRTLFQLVGCYGKKKFSIPQKYRNKFLHRNILCVMRHHTHTHSLTHTHTHTLTHSRLKGGEKWYLMVVT